MRARKKKSAVVREFVLFRSNTRPCQHRSPPWAAAERTCQVTKSQKPDTRIDAPPTTSSRSSPLHYLLHRPSMRNSSAPRPKTSNSFPHQRKADNSRETQSVRLQESRFHCVGTKHTRKSERGKKKDNNHKQARGKKNDKQVTKKKTEKKEKKRK